MSDYNSILALVKYDLGISSDKRNDYLKSVIEGAHGEIERKGITLDLSKSDDMMLLSDYAAWVYRKRTENVPISANLRLRIINRRVREAAKSNDNEQ